jgi:hypothetical protein
MKNKTRPNDINQLAHFIVQQVTNASFEQPSKNPAAVALGRLGGLKGGRARAKMLSAERRHQIACKAAISHWKNRK